MNMFRKLINNIGAVILIAILGLVLMGATYVNLGPTSNIDGDIGVTAGHGYYIDDVLLTYSDVDAQQADAALTSISGLTYVEDSLIKLTADDTYAVRTLSEVKTDLSLNYVENLKVKLDGTAAPAAATDDVTLGYVVGSRWFDVTNDKEYVCLDNTDGAAVWTETTRAGGGAETYLSLTDTPAAYDTGKYAKSTADGVVWDTPAGAGTVTTSGTPVQYDYARFTDATTIEGRSYTEMKTDLALDNVTNVAVDNTAYNATSWDANNDAATKNAIRDKIETMGAGYTNLTSFVDQTAWRVFYSNTDGDVVELALGADGTYLKSNGAAAAPIFAVPAGAGDVVKVGTPANSQVGVWTGDGTIEGAASLTYDGSNLLLTGDIGKTDGKITKGWFTDLVVTNAIAGSVTGNAATATALATGRTIGGVSFDGTANIVPNIVTDTTPELGGEMDAGAHSIGFTQQTVTYNVTTTTVDWTAGNKATVTLTGNVGTLAFTNPTNPCNVLLKIVQDGTGSRLITAYDADVKWAGGTKPTLTTTAAGIDICSFYWDGTNYFGVASLAFATP